MKEGTNTDWYYEILKDGDKFIPYNSNSRYTLTPLRISYEDEYQCCGRLKTSRYSKCSKKIFLNVRDKPRAEVTAGTTTISVGGSVTLSCSVDNSAGWKYQWFRRTSHTSEYQLKTNDEQNRTISVSQGGIYRCRGERGDPAYYSDMSHEASINITFSNQVVATRQPDWPQIFSGEKITLTCEIQGGETTEWMCVWRHLGSIRPQISSKQFTFTVSELSSGDYQCQCKRRDDSYSSTKWSEAIRLSVSASKPRASLAADSSILPAGGSVTLTCSVDHSADWKFNWFRDGSVYPAAQLRNNNEPGGVIRVSQGGLYRCRGGRGEPVFYTEDSHDVTIEETPLNGVRVTLNPDWPVIYIGEMFTLRCEIQGGGSAEWEYEWRTSSSHKPPNQREFRADSASLSHSGDYKCKGRNKSSQYNSTQWSVTFKLTISDTEPRPVLSVSPSWLSPGSSVTLRCEVEHPSAGWRFYWYKAVPQPSSSFYNYELTLQTADHSYIVRGQTLTAGYVCRAGRGDVVYYTSYSEPKFVWSGDSHPAASLTASPDRELYSVSDSVSLSCGGNSTEWRLRRFTEQHLLSISGCGSLTGSWFELGSLQEGVAVFWCESGSGQFSNAVNITAQSFRSESWSFFVPFFIGLVCGILLLLFVLLLCFYRKIKDACCNRLNQILNIDRVSATQQSVNENETQVYSSLLHGDAAVYESIRVCGNTGSDAPADEHSNVTSHLNLKGCDKSREHESSDYINVHPESATGP
ncbi:Fc receptor-like protein 5 [Melanotaenia boesemani]|uniref:Fc receptor-like protein 5 n=1 Tax=Melanotaenia boesemani TaxID=1250792 RepID=UPI001C046DB7|nr:Fc receptor-like protein 5 [Melanotaenia boesemani]